MLYNFYETGSTSLDFSLRRKSLLPHSVSHANSTLITLFLSRYAALFCGVATSEQALAMAAVLADPTAFLLNFSVRFYKFTTIYKFNPIAVE